MKHKHAEVIKAWADGAPVQFLSPSTGQWQECGDDTPAWLPHYEYRVKPEPVKLRYRRYVTRYGIFTVNEPVSVLKPEGVEIGAEFIKWIDKKWQEVEV